MKHLIIVFVIAYATNSYAQKANDNESSKLLTIEEAYTFVPPKKLLNKEIWTRVSNTRFECNFLRLAVEYLDFEYVLFEMDDLKRELSRAREYHIIGEEIAINSFRVSSNFTRNIDTNSTVSNTN